MCISQPSSATMHQLPRISKGCTACRNTGEHASSSTLGPQDPNQYYDSSASTFFAGAIVGTLAPCTRTSGPPSGSVSHLRFPPHLRLADRNGSRGVSGLVSTTFPMPPASPTAPTAPTTLPQVTFAQLCPRKRQLRCKVGAVHLELFFLLCR